MINFEDFQKDVFGKKQDTLTLICVATHYEGEPCDNTADFYKWIKQNKKEKLFGNDLQFAVFGLGDTAYEHFNFMGRYLDKTLQEMGGT